MSVSKPPYTHSIVNVKAGEVIPQEFMKMLCEEYSSCVGLVVREPDKLEIEKFLDLGEDRFAEINNININTKKFARQFTFHLAPTEFDEDECQPWMPIKDSKGKPILAVSCEGDFAGRTSNEGYSEAFVLMHEYLGPKLEDVYKLSGNNPQKLFEFLSSASFLKDLENTYSFRGAFAFMPTIGEPLMLGNFRQEGKGGADYEWGSASFNLGYTEAPPVEKAPPVKEATMPKNPPKVSKYATEAPVDPQVVPAQDPKPSVPITLPKKDGAVERVADKIAGEDSVKWAPPAAARGKGLKKAYRDMLGYLPEDWQQRPTFVIKAKDSPPAAKVEAPKPKDMKQEAPVIVLPVIDGNQQAKAVDFIKKHLGDGSLEIGNPLEAQKQESNLAVFSELCLKSGDLQEIRRWPVSGIFAFAKQNPEVMALAFVQLRRELINRVWDGGKTMGELTGTDNGKPVEIQPEKPLETKPSPTEAPPAIPEPRRASGGSKYA